MHKLLFFVVGLAAVVFAAPNFNTRILGGKKATPGQFKHQVSLRQNGQHFCGGSIISPTKILTAAHCIYGVTDPITITVGETNLREPGTSYKVSSTVQHEKFDNNTIVNDVAILTLEKPITYETNIQPIKLTDTEVSAGDKLTLSGWGLTSYPSNSAPDDLQYIDLVVMDNKECASKLEGGGPISSQQICTISPKETGACKGDSGGPLINQNGVQVGVVSWGVPCGKGYPDVFASVTYFRKWILDH